MRGPFFHKLALVEKFKEIFLSSNFDPFISSALQPSGKSYCFETHFTFQSGNCTCFYQILSLYLYQFSDGKGFKIALNFSRCSKLFAPTVCYVQNQREVSLYPASLPKVPLMNLTSPAALQGISRFFLLQHAYLNSTGPLKGLGHEIRIMLKQYGLIGLGQERVWQIFIIFKLSLQIHIELINSYPFSPVQILCSYWTTYFSQLR